ncbi:MAG: hypothetical protein GY952_14120 [Rhodobacteraceae bacterium]|nr:hypothetical protein [Paracoccaceae bacterium]
MAERNKPKTATTTLRTEVVKADPLHNSKDANHVEYRMSNGREFKGKVGARGAYSDDD